VAHGNRPETLVLEMNSKIRPGRHRLDDLRVLSMPSCSGMNTSMITMSGLSCFGVDGIDSRAARRHDISGCDSKCGGDLGEGWAMIISDEKFLFFLCHGPFSVIRNNHLHDCVPQPSKLTDTKCGSQICHSSGEWSRIRSSSSANSSHTIVSGRTLPVIF